MAVGEVLRLGLLLGAVGAAARGPHSLRYFLTGMTDPSPGMPRYVAVGYADGKAVARYDSESRRMRPIVAWLPQEEREHWDGETQKMRGRELRLYEQLDTLQKRYNTSGGAHTVQMMFGCDLLEDGRVRGYNQYAYDGQDFITFDMETGMFTVADELAEIFKRRWVEEGTYVEMCKQELGSVCVENLKRYLEHGKAVLGRRERPEVRVSGKEADGILTLSCRAHGFYPRPIAISWMKDGAVRDQDTHWGGIVPNGDGTYHAWAAIEVLPGDWDKYQCRVEHASLGQPGLYSWEPRPNLIPAVAGVVVAVVAIIAGIVGFVVWKSKSGKGQQGYRVAPGLDGGSGSLATGSESSL